MDDDKIRDDEELEEDGFGPKRKRRGNPDADDDLATDPENAEEDDTGEFGEGGDDASEWEDVEEDSY